MARALAKNGVTSFCPTSMSLPESTLTSAFENAAAYEAHPPAGAARVLGINMEGPFLSKENKGAQKESYLQMPDLQMFDRLQAASGNRIKIVCIAPELPGALAFALQRHPQVVVSAAHTMANYEQAVAGFEAGFSHVTHLFNTMPPLRHHAPGLIGAAAERPAVMVELIADGIHVHPSIVRLVFSSFGAERVCLISDSMEACFMPDGTYGLGGQQVFVQDGQALLADGTIAGSAASLADCLRNCIRYGIPAEATVRAASYNPAKRLGMEASYGTIANGKRADFILCESDFAVSQVYIDGVLVQ